MFPTWIWANWMASGATSLDWKHLLGGQWERGLALCVGGEVIDLRCLVCMSNHGPKIEIFMGEAHQTRTGPSGFP